MVVAGWLVLFLSYGILFYGYATFFVIWEEEFQWSRSLIAGAFSSGLVVCSVLTPIAGRLADVLSPRRLMMLGSFPLAGGVVLLSRITDVWQLYLFTAVLAMGFVMVGIVPLGVLLSRWFKDRRSLAIGIAQSGMGFGGVGMALLATLLTDYLGWRTALVALGLIVWCAVLPVAAMVRSHPQDMGLLPDGIKAGSRGSVEGYKVSRKRVVLSGYSLQEALRTRQFWAIVVINAALGITSTGIFSQIVPLMNDLEFSPRSGAIALMMVGLSNAAGKIYYGYLGKKVGLQVFLILAVVGNITVPASVLLVTMLGAPGGVIFGTALLVGTLSAALNMLAPLAMSAIFGLRHLGSLTGVVIGFETLAVGSGPVLFAGLFDVTGSYNAGAFVFLAILVIALVLTFLVPPVKMVVSDAKITRRH